MGIGNSKDKVLAPYERPYPFIAPCSSSPAPVTKEQKKEIKAAFRQRADASGFVVREYWVEVAVENGIVKELAELIFNAFDKGEGFVVIHFTLLVDLLFMHNRCSRIPRRKLSASVLQS